MVKIKRCKNCKYYSAIVNKCSCKKFVYTGEGAIVASDGVGYWDCESYSAGFNVSKNFGCIHFKEK